MLYLFLSILCSVSVSTILRFSNGRTSSQMTMLGANYLTCSVCGLLMAGNLRESFSAEGVPYALLLSLIGGILSFFSLFCLNRSIQRNGLVLSSLFSKLGVIIPTLVSVFFFGERLSVFGIIGLGLALVAIILMNTGIKSEPAITAITGVVPHKIPKPHLLSLLLVSGIASSMTTIFDNTANPATKNVYLAALFFCAIPCCIILLLINHEKPKLIDVAFGVSIGIPTYFCTRFLLLSFSQLSAAAAYPAQSVGSIALACLAGVILFKEKITVRQILALVLIAGAIVLLKIN